MFGMFVLVNNPFERTALPFQLTAYLQHLGHEQYPHLPADRPKISPQ